jgi:hypothetical protein
VPVAARGLPFSIHQVAEYLIGLGLIAQAVQGSKSLLPIVFGAAVLLSAALTDGPLAGWKTVSRPAHKVVDIVLATVALLLAVLPWSGADASGRAVLLIAAALLGMLILRTSYVPKPVRAPRNRGDLAEDVGRSAGRMVGKGLKAYRDGRRREENRRADEPVQTRREENRRADEPVQARREENRRADEPVQARRETGSAEAAGSAEPPGASGPPAP